MAAETAVREKSARRINEISLEQLSEVVPLSSSRRRSRTGGGRGRGRRRFKSGRKRERRREQFRIIDDCAPARFSPGSIRVGDLYFRRSVAATSWRRLETTGRWSRFTERRSGGRSSDYRWLRGPFRFVSRSPSIEQLSIASRAFFAMSHA